MPWPSGPTDESSRRPPPTRSSGSRSQAGTGSVVRFWEIESGRPFGTPLRFAKMVRGLAFLPDGTLVTAGDDHTAQVWDPTTGRPLGPPLPHDAEVTAVAVSPDGGMIATGSADRTARLWDARTGRPVGRPLAHQGNVTSVAFRPDGRVLLTASMDHTARQWDLATGEPLGVPLRHRSTRRPGQLQPRRPPDRDRGSASRPVLGRRHRQAGRPPPAARRLRRGRGLPPGRSAPVHQRLGLYRPGLGRSDGRRGRRRAARPLDRRCSPAWSWARTARLATSTTMPGGSAASASTGWAARRPGPEDIDPGGWLERRRLGRTSFERDLTRGRSSS